MFSWIFLAPLVTVGRNFTQPAESNVPWLRKSMNSIGPLTRELVYTNPMLKEI